MKKYFGYKHLSEELQKVSAPLCVAGLKLLSAEKGTGAWRLQLRRCEDHLLQLIHDELVTDLEELQVGLSKLAEAGCRVVDARGGVDCGAARLVLEAKDCAVRACLPSFP